MLLVITILVLVIIIIWAVKSGKFKLENFRSCATGCNLNVSESSLSVLNPFKWPYSGSSCPSYVYQIENEKILNSNQPNDAKIAEKSVAENNSNMDTLSSTDHDVSTN